VACDCAARQHFRLVVTEFVRSQSLTPAAFAADRLAAPRQASDGPLPMTDDNNTAFDANQIDEDVLICTVSDEALEAAAGIESQNSTVIGSGIAGVPCCPGTS
jgi:hypothetical protein